MDELLQRIPEPVRDFLLHALAAIVILALGWWLVRFTMEPLRRLFERSRVDPSAASFLVNTARVLLLIVVIFVALQQLGVQAGSLLALLGTVGLALALSLQGSLSNFASGLMVLSFRLVRVGDQVEIGDVRGCVTELLPFHVVVVTPDHQRITLPNNVLTSGAVKNNSALATRRVQWNLPLKSDDRLPAVKEAIHGRLKADSRILADPPPVLFLQDWSHDKRTLAVQAWTSATDHQAVQQTLFEDLAAVVESERKPADSPKPSKSD